MLNTIKSEEREKNKNGNWFKKGLVVWALAATLIWWWAYLAKDKISFSSDVKGETKEYVIDAKQNSIIKILKYNILNENQKTDGVLCYKLAQFIMKDNNIKNPRALRSWTPIKFNMDEINKIIKEHEELKMKKLEEISEDGLDIYEDIKETNGENSNTKEEEELQEIISQDIEEEADVELDRANESKNTLSKGYEEMRCKEWEYFWIDISHFNKRLDCDKLIALNRKKWDSKKPDVRWMSFVFIRSSDGLTADSQCSAHTNVIRRYNTDKNVIANKEKIAVWYYHRMSPIGSWVEQANLFLKLYKKNQWVSGWNTLIPMLDFEWGWLKTISVKDARIKASNWLSTVEKWTGVTPGLYVTPYIYKRYFAWDSRFKDFPLWIAAYPPSDKKTKKEIWTSPRINFKEWSVNVAYSSKDPKEWVNPACYQSSQQWKLPWTGDRDWYTDVDHSKNMDLIVTVQNKSDWKWENIVLENPKTIIRPAQKWKSTVNKAKAKADKKAKGKRREQKKSRQQQRKNKK